ncbi:hypothetical protein NQZ68_013056 [Dissostichus eleginoides]|nr:hypothetical protein NQZ68_013056 [Dissostichus eleginoides]
MDSKRSSRTQNAFAELPAGKGEQHVSSCQAQLLASEVIRRPSLWDLRMDSLVLQHSSLVQSDYEAFQQISY